MKLQATINGQPEHVPFTAEIDDQGNPVFRMFDCVTETWIDLAYVDMNTGELETLADPWEFYDFE